MNPRVFLSYRREDSAAYAGRIEDRLRRALGRNQLFMDVDNIPLGVNFAKLLQEEVAKCDVLLVMIGRNWLGARGDDGKCRLDNPDDFVRIEIATALRRNVPVIPILLDGAALPKAQELPEELRDLTVSNALDLRHASFHADVNKLIRSLKAPHRIENMKRVCVGCGTGFMIATVPGLLAVLLLIREYRSLEVVASLRQRAFEFGVFIVSGAVAAVLRQRGGNPLTAVAVSTILALSIFAVQQLLIPTSVLPEVAPALYGYSALLFYLILASFYFLATYGAFSIYDRTSSVFKSLLVIGVTSYSVLVLLFALLIYAAVKLNS